MITGGHARPVGNLSLVVNRAPRTATPAEELSFADIIHFGTPNRKLPSEVNRYRRKNARNFARGLKSIAFAKALKLPTFFGRLSLVHIAKDGSWLDYGLVGVRQVTDDGVDFIVDAFHAAATIDNMKFHGLGTTNTAEDQTDSALIAEITTQYTSDNVRPTGTQTEGGSTNIYRTVGTIGVDATVAAVEHGILDQAAVGGGVLLDRTVFTVVNLGSGDSLQATYELTITAGG